MESLTRTDAVTFIESLRLTIGDRVGFKWMVAKLDALVGFVNLICDENEALAEYLESSGQCEAFESFRIARTQGQ